MRVKSANWISSERRIVSSHGAGVGSLADESRLACSGKDLGDGKPPSGKRGLGLGDVALAICHGVRGICGTINVNSFIYGVDIPDHERTGKEIVCSLGGHLFLGRT